MIVYLFLIEKMDVQRNRECAFTGTKGDLEADMLKVLETSYEIWTKCTTATGDAIRAKGVVEVMLINLRKRGFSVGIIPQTQAGSETSQPIEPPSVATSGDYMTSNQLAPVQFEELGYMMDTPYNLDWVCIFYLGNTTDESCTVHV